MKRTGNFYTNIIQGKEYPHLPYLLVILIISILLSSPLLTGGFFRAHDLNCHMYKAVATVDALLEGQIPPLIGPRLANGFGYSWNIFYAPLSAYIPAFIKIFIPTFLDSMKLFIFFTIALSGITMYYFALALSRSRNLALLTAVFYLTAPYRLEDIYIRGAMGEALAFVFIPIFFQGLYNVFYQDGKQDHLIAIGFTGLLLAHNISALMTAFAAVFYLLAHFKQLCKREVVLSFVRNGFLVLALSLFYLVPLLEHRLFGNYEVFLPDRMGSLTDLKAQTLYPHKMLFDLFAEEKLNFSLGLQFIMPLALLPLVFKQFIGNKNIIIMLLLGLASVFMVSFLFPWTVMPSIFSFIQFPWRFLVLAIFFLSIACSFILSMIYKELELKHLIPIFLLIFLYISPILAQTRIDGTISDDIFVKEDVISAKSIYSSGSAFFEYMPAKAKANIPYLAEREDKVLVTEGEAAITKEVKKGTHLSFMVNTASNTKLELPYLYYLGWQVNLEQGDEISRIEVYESPKGFAALEIPANTAGLVSVSFKGTTLTRVSYLWSFLTMIVFIIYILKRSRTYKA